MSDTSGGREGEEQARVRVQLADIVASNGPEILDDPRRVRAMLADTVPGSVREVNLVNIALLEGVPARLQAAAGPLRLQTEIENLIRQLERNNALHRDAAEWAVRTCGWTLGLIPPPVDLEPLPSTPTPPAAAPQREQAEEAVPPAEPAVDPPIAPAPAPEPPSPEPEPEPEPEEPEPIPEAPAELPDSTPVASTTASTADPSNPVTPGRRVPRAAVVGAVALALVVVLVAGVLVLGAGGGSGGSDDGGASGGGDPRALATSAAPTHVQCPGPATPTGSAVLPVTWGPRPTPLGGALQTNPAQAYRKFVVATDRGEVAGISMENGSQLFRDELDGPVVGEYGQEGAVYYGTTTGGLYRVDPTATAAERVVRVMKSNRPLGPVLVENGRAYIGRISNDGGLLVVDLRTGKVARTIPTDGPVFGQPRVDRSTRSVYFGSAGGRVYRLPLPGTGNEVVTHVKVGGRIEAGIRVGAGRVVAATTDGVVEAFRGTDGKQIWRRQLPRGRSSAVPGVFLKPTLDSGGTTVVATSDCRLIALDTSGTVTWQVQLAHPIEAAPLTNSGVVIAADTAGCVDLLPVARTPGHQIARSTKPCLEGDGILSMAVTKVQIRVGTRSGQMVILPLVTS